MIELMVALAVLAIILSVGLPQMSVFFKGGRMVTIPNDLLAGLHIARSEAIKRNGRVTMCKSADAGVTATAPVCATGNAAGWDDGWFVYVESSGAVLRVNTGVENKATITADAAIADSVTFTSRGTPGQSGVFTICDDRGDSNKRGVVQSASGRVQVTRVASQIGACPPVGS